MWVDDRGGGKVAIEGILGMGKMQGRQGWREGMKENRILGGRQEEKREEKTDKNGKGRKEGIILEAGGNG